MSAKNIHIARTAPIADSELAVRRSVVDKLLADCRAAGVPIGDHAMDVMERFATGEVDAEHLHHEMRVAAALEKGSRTTSTHERLNS